MLGCACQCLLQRWLLPGGAQAAGKPYLANLLLKINAKLGGTNHTLQVRRTRSRGAAATTIGPSTVATIESRMPKCFPAPSSPQVSKRFIIKICTMSHAAAVPCVPLPAAAAALPKLALLFPTRLRREFKLGPTNWQQCHPRLTLRHSTVAAPRPAARLKAVHRLRSPR